MILNRLKFFFFQAEDGIRDGRVTGVQTCALPISIDLRVEVDEERLRFAWRAGDEPWQWLPQVFDASVLSDEATAPRSEERRVGKECRSRWSPGRQKKKRYHNKRGECERWHRTIRV